MPRVDIALQRMRNERLTGTPFRSPDDAVRHLGAVQAQDYPAAKWGIGQRVKNCLDADVERAYAEGRILRTHVLRPTWHFVMPSDIRWMLELTAPRVRKAISYYDQRMELDATTRNRGHAAIARALRGGLHLTRAELGRALGDAGIDARGQRLGHVIMHAELDALICNGAPRGKQHTYALVEERAPGAQSMARDEALGELARRYFISHGPATAQDFAWWSGLTVADARAGIASVRSELARDEIGGKEYWFAPGSVSRPRAEPIAHLLPNYDEYFIGFKDRDALFDPSVPVDTGTRLDVLARHIITIDGRIAGGWRTVAGRDGVTVEARLFASLGAAELKAVEAAAERYGRFLGRGGSLLARTV
jgi:hypothetical protein